MTDKDDDTSGYHGMVISTEMPSRFELIDSDNAELMYVGKQPYAGTLRIGGRDIDIQAEDGDRFDLATGAKLP